MDQEGWRPGRSGEKGVETRRIRFQFLEWPMVQALVNKGCDDVPSALGLEYTHCYGAV